MISRSAYEEMLSLIEHLEAERREVGDATAKLALRRIEIDEQLEKLLPASEVMGSMVKPDAPVQPAKLVRNTMTLILREAKQPLHYREVYRRLKGLGVEVNGVDPLKTLAAHLSNDERFARVGGGYWGLSSWPQHMLVVPVDEDEDEEDVEQRPTRIPARPQVLQRVANGPDVVATQSNDFDDLDDVPF